MAVTSGQGKCKKQLKRHKGQHKTSHCKDCKMSFANFSTKKQYMKTVHPYLCKRWDKDCKDCKMSFTNFSTKKQHMKTVHPYLCERCDFCDNSFLSSSGLYKHMMNKHPHISIYKHPFISIHNKEKWNFFDHWLSKAHRK